MSKSFGFASLARRSKELARGLHDAHLLGGSGRDEMIQRHAIIADLAVPAVLTDVGRFNGYVLLLRELKARRRTGVSSSVHRRRRGY